jgi:hypothetical protein
MNNHDWNKYREEFPKRYWEHGLFDQKLSSMLESMHKQYQFKSALDVGGGVLGTLVLKDFAQNNNIETDLLDPFISVKPEWMRNKVDWSIGGQYDLIVARGSINYLTLEQMAKLKHLMSPSSILIANTFLNAPSSQWSEREVSNIHGEKGIEKSRLVGNVIEHEIIFPKYKHLHTFFYYPLEEYQKVWGSIETINYANNSSLIIVKRDCHI